MTQSQSLAEILPPGHQIGLVRWFNSKKQFGFITTDWSNGNEKDIFFHLNYNDALMGVRSPLVIGVSKHLKQPEKGDVVIFRTSANQKTHRTSLWAYWKDWEAVSLSLNPKSLYRVVGHYSPSHGINDTKGPRLCLWSGISLEVLYLKFPECREDLSAIKHYFRATIEDIHFEMLPVGIGDNLSNESKWQPYNPH